MKPYDHRAIEKKWQKEWSKTKLYETKDKVADKGNHYLLVEFPYPSGNLHVGHWYAFSVPDILARFLRMTGKNVLYPIGFDSFGLPAENAAIKHKVSPRKWTESNIAHMKEQIRSMGTMFDWSRLIETHQPGYYKWTQWLFLKLYERGLAYRKETAVNWCPSCKTVLANEQVVAGECERCGTEVVQKQMLQWNLKITDYADRLVDDLEPLDWPEQIKESQRNWIGRSEGAEIDFPLTGVDRARRVVILHGRNGTPDNYVFPWLKEELEKRGYEVEVPALPDTDEPDDEKQADYVERHCTLDKNTVILAQSFGGIVAMRLLERGHRVARVVMAVVPFSGNFNDGKERASVTAACKKGFDFKVIKKHAEAFIVLRDETDAIVPREDADAWREHLEGLFIEGRGNVPHFSGNREPDMLMASVPTLRVFTTRPDTLYGATYLVLSPEHPWLTLALERKTALKNNDEVAKYVKAASKKTELERQTEQKEKTGVRLGGVEALNPATGEKIPIYVADYVLGGYGTGAIMAVPAHDERDFAFAKKFNIPVRRVVGPTYTGKEEGAPKEGEDFVKRNAVAAVVRNPRDDTYLCISWKGVFMHGLVTGGVDEEEDVVEAARREVREETGYKNLRLVWNPGIVNYTKFYHRIKKQNRWAHFTNVFFELENEERDPIDPKEEAQHEVLWKKRSELKDFFSVFEGRFILDLLDHPDYVYTGQGTLHNSGPYDWMSSEEAKKVITEAFGRPKKVYKLRDWIVSRQRYWGVPIPIIHCPGCGPQPVPYKDLPVELPEVKDYLPDGKGKSPLAKAKRWMVTKCPACKGKAERETDTLDTFVDSSWYFLRYLDPQNKKVFADAKKMNHWMPVDLYSGGAEHTTMHVLYSRFWQKALFDLGLVADPEPYTRRMNRSLILGPDGQKMSKSKGNVIDPDEVVARLGADTVRMYLAFIGPYNEVGNYPWSPDGVVGVRRFLERVWRVQEWVQSSDVPALQHTLHKVIKKTGEDIAALKFNTAISQLMILLNAIEKERGVGRAQWEGLLKLLAPFAPHAAEEMWSALGYKSSLHLEAWPSYNPLLLAEKELVIAVQVDGKTRGETRAVHDASKEELERAAREAVASRLEGKRVVRTIVVPGRLVNFVLEKN